MPQSTGLSLDMSEGNRPQNRTHPPIPIEFGSLSLVLGLPGRALLRDTLEGLGRAAGSPETVATGASHRSGPWVVARKHHTKRTRAFSRRMPGRPVAAGRAWLFGLPGSAAPHALPMNPFTSDSP
ncbi:hypothetical protein [Burkholderia cepacia]|uniref:hypothetical protein n=1 Tax=Burkholderia cepacia TaxID=292 RepID=UPI000ACB64A5|nr:hypothetical protein [Burkholderia cepacia]QOH38361.1 hypothetical protein C7S14_1579 [Burkholderia cepacia]